MIEHLQVKLSPDLPLKRLDGSVGAQGRRGENQVGTD
jgi:hypothetical protein